MFFVAGLLALITVANAGGDHIKGGSHLVQESASQDDISPSPYSFNINSGASYGGKVSWEETGDAKGRIKGFYSVSHPRGTSRVVNYQEDEAGFRAHVKTSEPNIKTHSPANAHIETISKAGVKTVATEAAPEQGGKINLSALPFGVSPVISSGPLPKVYSPSSVKTVGNPVPEGLIPPFADQDLQLREPVASPVINSGLTLTLASEGAVKGNERKIFGRPVQPVTRESAARDSLNRQVDKSAVKTGSSIGRQTVDRNTQKQPQIPSSDAWLTKPKDLRTGDIQFTLSDAGSGRSRPRDATFANRVPSSPRATLDLKDIATLSEKDLKLLKPGQVITIKDGSVEAVSEIGSTFGQRTAAPNNGLGRQGLNVKNGPLGQQIVHKPASAFLKTGAKVQGLGQSQTTIPQVSNLSSATAGTSTNLRSGSNVRTDFSVLSSQGPNRDISKITPTHDSSYTGGMTGTYSSGKPLNPVSINAPFALDITPDMISPDGSILLSGIQGELAGLVSGHQGHHDGILHKNQEMSRILEKPIDAKQGNIKFILGTTGERLFSTPLKESSQVSRDRKASVPNSGNQGSVRNVQVKQTHTIPVQTSGFSRPDGLIVLNQELSPDELSRITVGDGDFAPHIPPRGIPFDQTLNRNEGKSKVDLPKSRETLQKDSQIRQKPSIGSTTVSAGNIQFSLGSEKAYEKPEIRKTTVLHGSITRENQNLRSNVQQRVNLRNDALKAPKAKQIIRKQPAFLSDAVLKEKGRNFFIMGDLSQTGHPIQNVQQIGFNIQQKPNLQPIGLKSKEKQTVRRQQIPQADVTLKDKGENYFILGDTYQSGRPISPQIKIPSAPVLQIPAQSFPGVLDVKAPQVQYVDRSVQSLNQEAFTGIVIDDINNPNLSLENFGGLIEFDSGRIIDPTLPISPVRNLQPDQKPRQNIPNVVNAGAFRNTQAGTPQTRRQTISGMRRTQYAPGHDQRKPGFTYPGMSSVSQIPIGGTRLDSEIAGTTGPGTAGVIKPAISRSSGGVLGTDLRTLSVGGPAHTRTSEVMRGTLGIPSGLRVPSGLRTSTAAGATGVRIAGLRQPGITGPRSSGVAGASDSRILSGTQKYVGGTPGFKIPNTAEKTSPRTSGTNLRAEGLAKTPIREGSPNLRTKPGAMNNRLVGGNAFQFTMGGVPSFETSRGTERKPGLPNVPYAQIPGSAFRSQNKPLSSGARGGTSVATGTRAEIGPVFQPPSLILSERGITEALKFGIPDASRDSFQPRERVRPGRPSITSSGKDIQIIPTVHSRTSGATSDQRKRGELSSTISSSAHQAAKWNVFEKAPGVVPVFSDVRAAEGLKRDMPVTKFSPGFGQRSSGLRKDPVLHVLSREQGKVGITERKLPGSSSLLSPVKGDIQKDISQVEEHHIKFTPKEESKISQLRPFLVSKASQGKSEQTQIILEDTADRSSVANPGEITIVQIQEPVAVGDDHLLPQNSKGQTIQVIEDIQKGPIILSENTNTPVKQEKHSNVGDFSGYNPKFSFTRTRGQSPNLRVKSVTGAVQEHQKLEQILI